MKVIHYAIGTLLITVFTLTCLFVWQYDEKFSVLKYQISHHNGKQVQTKTAKYGS